MNSIFNNSSTNIVNIYVKQVYTCLTQNYQLLDNIIINDMISILSQNINRDFNFNSDMYEIVEVNNIRLPINLKSEEAEAITNSSITTLKERYNNNSIAFYIRPIKQRQQQEQQYHPQEQQQQQEQQLLSQIECCMVCQEIENPVNSYFISCNHVMCETCNNGCIRAEITNCPLCRRT